VLSLSLVLALPTRLHGLVALLVLFVSVPEYTETKPFFYLKSAKL